MFQRLCHWILYNGLGWGKVITVPFPDKYVICLAPHTSNWDFFIGQLFMHAEGKKINFLIKKEWFKGPLAPVFRALGGIPVWRSQKTSMTDILANEAKKRGEFHLCVTPEGTRSLTTEWKKGFYYIALKAEIPILLFAADYERKLIQCTKMIVPNGDFETQIREIKLYYKDFKGKNQKNFSIGKVADED